MPCAMSRNKGSPPVVAVAPTRAVRRLTIPSTGARISVRASRRSSSPRCALAWARSASAMVRPKRAAARRPSAEREAATRCSSAASVPLPDLLKVCARSRASFASVAAASAWSIWLLPWARAAVARATAATFCITWVSSVSRDSRARTCPLATWSPSSTRSSVMRTPSSSGATRTSSRGTSVPDTSVRSTSSRGVASITLTTGRAAPGSADKEADPPAIVTTSRAGKLHREPREGVFIWFPQRGKRLERGCRRA